jgi:hypothetical protein
MNCTHCAHCLNPVPLSLRPPAFVRLSWGRAMRLLRSALAGLAQLG